MSMYSVSELTKDTEAMRKSIATALPKEMASAINLMAHPAAGVMAVSAMSFGLASQMIGAWVGAVSAATETSQRYLDLLAGEADSKQAPATAHKGAALSVAEAKVTDRVPEVVSAAPVAPEPMTSPEPDQPSTLELTDTALSALVSEAPRAPAAIAKPEQSDDLKAISGIGPKLEKVLNDLGIWTYAQIAAWTPEEIAWVDEFLGFKGRIERDRWVAQAAEFASAPKMGERKS